MPGASHTGSTTVEAEVTALWQHQASVPGPAAHWLDYSGVQSLLPDKVSRPRARAAIPELTNLEFDADFAQLCLLLPPLRLQVRRLDGIVSRFWAASQGLQHFSRSTRTVRGGSMRAAEELMDDYNGLRLEANRAIRQGNTAVHAVLARAAKIRHQAQVTTVSPPRPTGAGPRQSSRAYQPETDGVPDPLRSANALVVAACSSWQRAVRRYCAASVLHDHEFRAKFEAMLRLHRLLPAANGPVGSLDQLPMLVEATRGVGSGRLYAECWDAHDRVLDEFVGCEEVAAMKLLRVNRELSSKAKMFSSPPALDMVENASLMSQVEGEQGWAGLLETDWAGKRFNSVAYVHSMHKLGARLKRMATREVAGRNQIVYRRVSKGESGKDSGGCCVIM